MPRERRRVPLTAVFLVALGGLSVAVAGWLEWGRLVPGDGTDAFVLKGSWLVIGLGAGLALLGIGLAAVRTRWLGRLIAVPVVALGLVIAVIGAYGALDDSLLLDAAADHAAAGSRSDAGATSASLRGRIATELRADVDLGRTGLRVGPGLWWLVAGGLAVVVGGMVVVASRRPLPEGPEEDAAPAWEPPQVRPAPIEGP